MIRRFVSLLLVLTTFLAAGAQNIPPRPEPARFVNDYAKLLNKGSLTQALEDTLAKFNDLTSTQIVVFTARDLGYYEPSDFAIKLGEAWGIGQAGKDNGVLILIKPKTSTSNGQAFIATGYGLEGVLPDVTCSRIANEKMIPFFKENKYAEGIVNGVLAVMTETQKEYGVNGDNLPQSDDSDFTIEAILVIIALVFIPSIFLFVFRNALEGFSIGGGGGSSFSSGSSYSGGSSFGGGHFGGGGGGGSW